LPEFLQQSLKALLNTGLSMPQAARGWARRDRQRLTDAPQPSSWLGGSIR